MKLTDPVLNATTLNALDADFESASIDASSVTQIRGSISDLNTAYGSYNNISGLNSDSIIISDTTISATDLNNLDTKVTVGNIDASSVTQITGSL